MPNEKKPPVIPLDVEDTDETREPTGEDLRFNEEENSFELEPETADDEYDHPAPYDTAAPEGEDDNSTYDEENPYTPNEYRDKRTALQGELEELDGEVVDNQLVQLNETDRSLAETPEDDREDLDEEGYPTRDDAGGDHNPIVNDPEQEPDDDGSDVEVPPFEDPIRDDHEPIGDDPDQPIEPEGEPPTDMHSPMPEIPRQYTGKQLDLDAKTTLPDESSARDFFALAKRRLLDVNHWHEVAEIPASTFVLTDAYGGEAVKFKPEEGDNIRIDIPGPGPAAGDGYDWVAVEEITEAGDSRCSLTLRPTDNPLKLNGETAHFFQDVATSTLIVERKGQEVIARYHGRNEVTNTDTDSVIDNTRNAAVGIGAKLGLSYPQWKSLVAGLVKRTSP